MKIEKLVSITAVSLVLSSMLYASAPMTDNATSTASNKVKIKKGWKLLGTSYNIPNMDIVFGKKSVATVWAYDDELQKWMVYSPDEDIRLQIMGSDIVVPLKELKVNSGYWVLGNYDDEIELNATTNDEIITIAPPPSTSDGTIATTCNAYNCFEDQLQPVTLETIAGKTFKVVVNDYESDDEKNILVTFDANGNASIDTSNAPTWMQYYNNSTITFNSTDGTLDIKPDEYSNTVSYKILASDTNGIIFGNTNLDNWDWNYLSDDSRTIIALNDGTTPTDTDMATLIPYTVYDIWSNEDYWRVYGDDGYVTYYSKWGDYTDSWQGEEYSIVNKAIATQYEDFYEYDGNYYGYSSKDSLQVVYNIGRYRVQNHSYEGTNWTDHIEYVTDTTTYSYDILKLDASHDTWQEIFASTNNMIWSQVYKFDDGSTTKGKVYDYYDGNVSDYSYATFEISAYGKTLSTTWEGSSKPWIRTIENIVTADGTTYIAVKDQWNDSYYELTSEQPIVYYNEGYVGTYNTRPLPKPKTIKSYKDALDAKLKKIRRK